MSLAEKGVPSDIICHCYDVKRQDIRRYFEQPGATIDDFVGRTNFGRKCTACLLDFDRELSQLGTPVATSVVTSTKLYAVPISGSPEERLESGFYLNRDGIRTLIHLANHNASPEAPATTAPHRGILWLFAPSGDVVAKRFLDVDAGKLISLDFGDSPRCPSEGWFLLSLRPRAPGYMGTLRPQVALTAQGCAVTYHTQPHKHATRSGWRSGLSIRATGGRTRTAIPIINGTNLPATVTLKLHTGATVPQAHVFELPRRGFRIVDLDDVFKGPPSNTSMLLEVTSTQPTRKFVLNRHPGGTLGVDHFPGLP